MSRWLVTFCHRALAIFLMKGNWIWTLAGGKIDKKLLYSKCRPHIEKKQKTRAPFNV